MYLSVMDALRCPAAHEESSLVLSAEAWEDMRITSGMLGCPVCHARYAITHGVVQFSPGATRETGPAPGTDAMRLAAQLGLSEPGGLMLLIGAYASAASSLVALVDVTCLLVDSSAEAPDGCVRLEVGDRLPLASASLRGAAVDRSRASDSFLAEVVRCTRQEGRLVAPATVSAPTGVRVLARDDSEWVGMVEGIVPAVPLRRAQPRG